MKRGNGEGTIWQLPSGRWRGQTTYTGEDGRVRRKSVSGRTQADVVKALRHIQTDIQRGLPPPPDKLTVAAYLLRWLESKRDLRPLVFRSYESCVRINLAPAFERVRLLRLSVADVERYQREKLEAGLSAQTVLNHHAILRKALNDAMRQGLVHRNVAAMVPAPKVERAEIQPLTPAEARVFREALEGDRLAALYLVTITLGLRQGEALGLRWEDIDPQRATLTVRHKLQLVKGVYSLAEPKTAKSRRTLALPRELVDVLRAHREQQQFERKKAEDEWQGDKWGLVFCSPFGGPLNTNSVTHRFQKKLESLGLPRQRFHDLRHAAASYMLAQGVALRVVQEVLGHSRYETTANIYAHVMPEMARDATQASADLLWGTGS